MYLHAGYIIPLKDLEEWKREKGESPPKYTVTPYKLEMKQAFDTYPHRIGHKFDEVFSEI
jgi:hypothetical protein